MKKIIMIIATLVAAATQLAEDNVQHVVFTDDEALVVVISHE